MIAIVGRHAFDVESVKSVAKTLGACALVVVVDRILAPIGWSRLVVEAMVYFSVVVASGALQTRELFVLIATAMRQRAQRG